VAPGLFRGVATQCLDRGADIGEIELEQDAVPRLALTGCVLGPLALRDVADRDDAACSAAERHVASCDLNREACPVLAEAVGLIRTGSCPGRVLPQHCAGFRSPEREHVGSEQLTMLVAEHAANGLVAVDDGRFVVYQDPLRRRAGQSTVAVLALPKRLLDPLLLSQVPCEREDVLISLELHVVGGDLDRELALVSAAMPGAEAQGAVALELRPVLGPAVRREVGVNVGNRHPQQLRVLIPEQPAGCLVDVHEAPGGARPVDGH